MHCRQFLVLVPDDADVDVVALVLLSELLSEFFSIALVLLASIADCLLRLIADESNRVTKFLILFSNNFIFLLLSPFFDLKHVFQRNVVLDNIGIILFFFVKSRKSLLV